jgi:hypothetical protein
VTSSEPITTEPDRNGATIASLTPLSRISARIPGSPSFGPAATVSPLSTARPRSAAGVLLSSIKPGASTRALSISSG